MCLSHSNQVSVTSNWMQLLIHPVRSTLLLKDCRHICLLKILKITVINITYINKTTIKKLPGFPGGAVVENLPANAGDTGSSPGLGRPHMPRSN